MRLTVAVGHALGDVLLPPRPTRTSWYTSHARLSTSRGQSPPSQGLSSPPPSPDAPLSCSKIYSRRDRRRRPQLWRGRQAGAAGGGAASVGHASVRCGGAQTRSTPAIETGTCFCCTDVKATACSAGDHPRTHTRAACPCAGVCARREATGATAPMPAAAAGNKNRVAASWPRGGGDGGAPRPSPPPRGGGCALTAADGGARRSHTPTNGPGGGAGGGGGGQSGTPRGAAGGVSGGPLPVESIGYEPAADGLRPAAAGAINTW